MKKTSISSLEHFRAIFKDFPDAISVNRLSDGQNLAVNKSFTALTGFAIAKIGSWISFEDWHRLVAEVRKHGLANGIAVTLHTNSGAVRQAQIVARRIEFESTPGLLIITSDITEQQELSETLRERETELQHIFDNAATGIAFTDASLRIRRANRTLAAMFGCQVEELIGQLVSTLTVTEDYTAEDLLLKEIYSGQRNEYRLEKRSLAKNGRIFWTAVAVSAVRSEDGQLRYLLGMITDIDNRKKAEESLYESEEKYRTIFSAGKSAIFLTDPPTGIILEVNPAASRIYGYSLDELIGMNFADLSADCDEDLGDNSSRQNYSLIPYHKKKDGSVFPVEISSSQFKQHGQAVHLATIRDITERRRVEQEREGLLTEVQQAHAQLQSLSAQLFAVQENERRSIAYDLHDEIGQAILAIKANLETLQLANESMELAEQIAASVKIADTALEQIRSLALDLRPAMLDDFGLAATLEWYLERQARSSRLKISFQSDLPDEQRFTQVIETAGFRVAQTAFMNIVRHSQAKHVHVTLGLIDEDRELELVLRDDGVGFDVAAALAQAQRGQSLGLLGLQERVRLVGGASSIKSTPGVGTEIRVRFLVQARQG